MQMRPSVGGGHIRSEAIPPTPLESALGAGPRARQTDLS